jgi:curved DNA-binding protein CbpA
VDQKASGDEIRKSYRKKAVKLHPDKGGDQQKVRIILMSSFKSYNMLMKSSPIQRKERSMTNMVKKV